MQSLNQLWQIGVDAVRGEASVLSALDRRGHGAPDSVIAVGKAACDMARPVLQRWPQIPALIVTKHDHAAPLPGAPRIFEAGHPIPDEASLRAGAALRDFVSAQASDCHLLCLVSGGASAVAELLPEGMTLTEWQEQTQALMASGADIHEINRHRRSISQIKGGKLLAQFPGAQVSTFAISDVEGDDLNVIGSGIGLAPAERSFTFHSEIIASNAIARAAVADASELPVTLNEETLYDDVRSLAPKLAQKIRAAAPGLMIFGGEPTVVLPTSPGRGGRNQMLALMLAREISGMDGIEILVAGTDGTDGPTPDAGGLVDGQTWQASASDYITRADAGSFLAQQKALFTTGPTGTNVMDLMLVRKR